MTEDEARDWLRERFGSQAMDLLERYVALLLAESARQSIIARSTFDSVWSRHIADSAQLIPLAPPDGLWLDIGSGGGLPGIVAAILQGGPIVMVEPRRKRAEFLRATVAELGLTNARVVLGSAQNFDEPAAVITARAVSALEILFSWTRQNVSRETLYLLPRGESASSDLAIAQRAWHGSFHVEQSLTNPAAGIIVARDVRLR